MGDVVGIFGAARRASGLTFDEAARACCVSRPTVYARERDPGQYRLCELKALYDALDETGRALLMQGVAAYVQGVGE